MGNTNNNLVIEAKAYLYLRDNIIIEVNKEFTELTGFTEKKILGKSSIEIGVMLKIHSQILLDEIHHNYLGFIFTESLEPREVDISIVKGFGRNEKKYTFVEIPNSRLQSKLNFVEHMFDDDISGVAIFSVPDFIMLKTNQMYIDFFDEPYNKEENSLGRPIRQIINGFQGSQSEFFWNKSLKTQKPIRIKQRAWDKFARGTTYWDSLHVPIFENGQIKYILANANDVTERVLKNKSIEEQNKIIQTQKEELQQQKEQLVSIIENIPIGVYINYKDGRVVQLNEMAKKAVYKPDKLVFLGDSYSTTEYFALDGENLPLEKTPSYRALRGETVKNEKIIAKQPDKKLVLEISSSPVYDELGNIIMSITCSHDVTELININEEIKRQKEQLEVLIDNIHEEIYIVDSNGKYIMFNDSAKKRRKHCKVEKIYDGYDSFEYYDLSGNRLSKNDMPISKLMKGESIKNHMMIGQDPDRRYLCTNGEPIFDHNGSFSLGIISLRDVTKDVLYKQSIERQLEMLTKLIKNLDLPVIQLSYPDLTIIDINQKHYSIMKATTPEINSINDIIGKNYWEFVIEEDIIEHIHKEVSKNKIPYLRQRKWRISGEDRFFTVLYQPVFGDNGEIEKIVSVAFDVTSEVKANSNMKQTLKMQDEIFANISHELKTPLNVIYSTVQLFNLYCNSGSLDANKASIVKYIDSIKKNSYRLSKLVNNIVDISKIEAGFFELNLSNNNIVETVEEIVMSVTNFTEIKGLNIIFDTDTEEKIIGCDPEKIERILLNLISNAIKFSNFGDEIFVEVKDKNEFVEISVKDNGIGLEENHMDMIFHRFKQVDKSLSRNSEGTGIGLSLVKSLVELHGGSISVESKFGKGSKFTVSLPAKKVMQENMLFSSNLRVKSDGIQVEFSDICL